MNLKSEENSSKDGQTHNLLAVSASLELAESFMSDICGPLLEKDNGLCIGGVWVEISTLAGDPAEQSDWSARIAKASALIFLVQHVDALSVKDLAKVYCTLPDSRSPVPIAFFIVREPNKKEFKFSCLKCGQKIMLRDEYVGRSCSCPNCKKAIRIVSQKMALRQQLNLSIDTQVEQVDGANSELTKGALERLIERATPVPPVPTFNHDDLMTTTMRIELPDLS